jgi:DNA excision repair protein ERCC-4
MADLLYDHREDPSGIPELLQREGLELEKAQLPIGDYVVSERLIIERKSGQDFVASIKDGRLWDQAERMREQYQLVVFLLHGQPRFPQASLEGAMAGLIRRQTSLVQVADEEAAARMIYRLYRQENKSRTGQRRPRPSRKLRGPDEIAEDLLAALPGISIAKAGVLLDHFGSLQAVLASNEDQLLEVPGIGKKTAAGLVEIFCHQRGQTPWD